MSADPAREAVKQFRRRLTAVLEHEPRELHIALNGRILGSHTVNAELNRQNLLLDSSERVDFIEVFSEQGVRLLSMSVEPPPIGPFEHRVEAKLSSERTLQAVLSYFGASPSLEIIYRDPNFRAVTEMTVNSRLHSVDPFADISDSQESGIHAHPIDLTNPSKWWALPWVKGGMLVTATALVLLTFFALVRSPIPAVSAAELLRQSAVFEQKQQADPGVVLHRSLSFTVRNSRTGSVQLQRRVETWQSMSKGIKVRRLFDEQNVLVAGEWRHDNGSSTLYRSGAAPETVSAATGQNVIPLSIENVWLREPSAADFVKLSDSGTLTVREDAAAYHLTLSRVPSPLIASGLPSSEFKHATLLLLRPELRPVEQSFVTDSASGGLEYVLRETGFEQRAAGEVAAAIFEPDALFFPIGAIDLALATPSPSPSPSVAPVPLPVALATADLEVEALSLLNEVGATLGEEVSVARTIDGSLQVSGVVDGAQRKTAILAALKPIAGHPAVLLQIETAEEAALRLEKSRAASDAALVQIEESSPSTGQIAVDAELRRHLFAKGISPDKLDEEVNQFANRALMSSRQALLYAWSLRRMVQRFSPGELQSLDREARTKWLSMIGDHARGCQREIENLRAHLSLAFTAKAAADETATEIADEAGLARNILRMAELSTNTDETIRSAFTLSGVDGSALNSSQFWRAMSNAEFLARRIEQGAQQMKASTGRTLR